MSKKTQELVDYTFDPESVLGETSENLSGAILVNGKTKKAKFDKKTGTVSNTEGAVVIEKDATATDAVFYALGTADVKAYYFNENLPFDVAATVKAGVFNNYGTDMDLTFARGAATTKIYAYGKDVTLIDAAAGDIFAGAYNPYNAKNANASIQRVAADSEINVLNTTVKNIYAGGEGDAFYKGDVVVNIYNSKVGKIYAGGTKGAYTQGDLTVVVSNNGNKNANGANLAFTGAVYGTAADKNSMSWGTTSVVVTDYKGDYKGAFNYVDTVMVSGDSDVTFTGAFKEVGTIAVAGGATAVVNKNGAYAYELVLTSETLANSAASMLTVGKSVKAIDKVVVTVNDDFADNGPVNLLSWAGYLPKKGAEAVVPYFSVKNENGGYDGNGGIVADYKFSYNFDANNNLVFEYEDAAYVLEDTVVDPVFNANGDLVIPAGTVDFTGKVFGAADDKVVFGNIANYNGQTIDLGAGANEIDLTNLNAPEFKLTVGSNKSKNIVDAVEFSGDVTILDRGGKETNNVVAVGDNTRDVDFKGSKDATLVVEGGYTGNVDFTSVANDATVKLENGASMNAADIVAGEKDVVVAVDAYNTATLNGFDVEKYVLEKNNNFVDIALKLGTNARIDVNGADNDFVVQNYNKNIYADKALTYSVVQGALGSEVIIDNTIFTLNNYGVVNGDIEAVKGGKIVLKNYGKFTGSYDATYAAAVDTILVEKLPNNKIGDVELGGSFGLGAGDDTLTFEDDVKVSAAFTKVAGSGLEITVQNGTTVFSGSINYLEQGDSTDKYVPADEDGIATGVNATNLALADATLNIESSISVNTFNITNGTVTGDFDAANVNVNGGNVVFGTDAAFRGNLTVAGVATLTAQNVTAGGYVDVKGVMTSKDLTAGGYIAVYGTLDADGAVSTEDAFYAFAGSVVKADSITADTVQLSGTTEVEGDVTAKEGDAVLNGLTTIGGNLTSDKGAVAVSNDTTVAGAVSAKTTVTATTAGAATAISFGSTSAADVNVDAADAKDVISTGDITATAVYNEEGIYIGGGDVNFSGAGKIVTGAITADKALNNDVAELEIGGLVSVKDFAIKDGQTVTFGYGAAIDNITAAGTATMNFGAALNAKTADQLAKIAVDAAANLSVVGVADANVDINADVDLDTNAKLKVQKVNVNGTVTELTNGAEITISDAYINKVVFNGSVINVENAGVINELVFNTAMTINGVISDPVENDVVDVLTINSGLKIADDDATVKTLNINTATVVGDIDFVNDLAYGNVNTYGTVTIDGYVEATVTAVFATAADTLTLKGVKGNVIGNPELGAVVVDETAEGSVNAMTAEISVGNWVAKDTDVISGKSVAINNQVNDELDASTFKGDVYALEDIIVNGNAYDMADTAALNAANGDIIITGAKDVAAVLNAVDANPADEDVVGNVGVEAAGTVTSTITATNAAGIAAKDVAANVTAAKIVVTADNDVTGVYNATETATVVAGNAVDATVIGNAVTVNAESVAGKFTANNGELKVSVVNTVVKAALNVVSGPLTVEGATEIAGDIVATNSEINVNDALISGNISLNATNGGDYTYNFVTKEYADNKISTNTTVNAGGNITLNITADKVYAIAITGTNTVVNYTVDGAAKDSLNDAKGYNVTVLGEYNGNIGNAGKIAVQGNYFKDNFAQATVNAAGFVVAGDGSEESQAVIDKFFADKKATVNPTHKSTLDVLDEVAAKYSNGVVYAKVNVTGEAAFDKLFVGTVEADKVVFAQDATAALDTVDEIAPGTEMDAKAATAPADKDLVNGTTNVIANGNVYGNKEYYVNKEYREGDKAREKVVITNGATVTATDVYVKGDFFGTVNATGNTVFEGDIVGGMREVVGVDPVSGEEISNPEFVKSTSVTAGTFENTNADATIKADITANGVDFIEEGVIVQAAVKAVADIEGNVTATAGSVDVKSVTGFVNAAVNADVNGNVGTETAPTYLTAGNDATVTGTVFGNLTAGRDADVTGAVKGDVAADRNATVKGTEVVVNNITATNGFVLVEGDVNGNVNAGTDADVTGDVAGYVKAADNATVFGDVDGYVAAAAGNAFVTGDVKGGNVTAGKEVYVEGDVLVGGVTAGTDAKVYGNVELDVYAANNVYVDGNVLVGGVTANTGSATVLGTVGGDVTAADTATLSGNVGGDVTAESVIKGENAAEFTTVAGVVTATNIELAEVAVGGVVAGDNVNFGAGNVTVGAVNGDFEFYASEDRTIVAGDVTGDVTIANGQDPANLAPSIVIDATFGNIKATSINFSGLTYLYEAGEYGPYTVTSEINATADIVTANTIAIDGGRVTLDADYVAKSFSTVDDSVVGINLTSADGYLVLNARTYVSNVTGNLDLVINKDFSNGLKADGDILDTKANVAVKSLEIGAEAHVMGVKLTVAEDITFAARAEEAKPALMASTVVKAASLVFEAEEVKLSKYFSPNSSFTVDKIKAVSFIVDQALTLTKTVELTGNLTVAETGITYTGVAPAITLTADNAVVDIAGAVGKGIMVTKNATINQIVGTSISGSSNDNEIVFAAGTANSTGSIVLGDGADKLVFNADVTAGAINGGNGKDTLEINAEVTAGNITNVESFVFGENGSLDAKWSIGAATEVKFAAVGEKDAVISGVTVAGLTDANFVLVGEDKWMWNTTEKAFVNGDDKLAYDGVKKELTWTLA